MVLEPLLHKKVLSLEAFKGQSLLETLGSINHEERVSVGRAGRLEQLDHEGVAEAVLCKLFGHLMAGFVQVCFGLQDVVQEGRAPEGLRMGNTCLPQVLEGPLHVLEEEEPILDDHCALWGVDDGGRVLGQVVPQALNLKLRGLF